MASPNTLDRRNRELNIRTTMCGPHDNGVTKHGRPALVPTAGKPFTARNGHEYVYNRNGAIERLIAKPRSRKAKCRQLGGKAAYRAWLDEQSMLEIEQGD